MWILLLVGCVDATERQEPSCVNDKVCEAELLSTYHSRYDDGEYWATLAFENNTEVVTSAQEIVEIQKAFVYTWAMELLPRPERLPQCFNGPYFIMKDNYPCSKESNGCTFPEGWPRFFQYENTNNKQVTFIREESYLIEPHDLYVHELLHSAMQCTLNYPDPEHSHRLWDTFVEKVLENMS